MYVYVQCAIQEFDCIELENKLNRFVFFSLDGVFGKLKLSPSKIYLKLVVAWVLQISNLSFIALTCIQ